MKNSQKRAIWYACREKQLFEQKEELNEMRLLDVFNNQKTYKNMTWFLYAAENKSEKFKKAVREGFTNYKKKMLQFASQYDENDPHFEIVKLSLENLEYRLKKEYLR